MPRTTLLRHPEHIHPALWKASQLAQSQRPTLSTGFRQLDAQLPGQGWPIGALIEISLNQPGIGEIALLSPALAQLESNRCVMLVHPPYPPYFHCWNNWGLGRQRLFWVQTGNTPDSLWACEQALRHNACAALLCWAPGAHPSALRRLHLAARQSDTLFVMLRSPAESRQPCAAPLRLAIQPAPQGLVVSILKRSGPACLHSVSIPLHPSRAFSSTATSHAPLDLPSLASSQSRRGFPVLAH